MTATKTTPTNVLSSAAAAANAVPPSTTPFHAGEVAVQDLMGVKDTIGLWARKVVRPYMPEQHRQFYESQPFLVGAARDSRGKLWSTLFFGRCEELGFVSSPDASTLHMDTAPVPGDALEGSFRPGSDLGILGIEFATKRRNRVNGRIVSQGLNQLTRGGGSWMSDGSDTLEFKVDQSFGNCPQYIKPRKWWTPGSNGEKTEGDCQGTTQVDSAASPIERPKALTASQISTVRSAETIFIATGYRGEGEDPRYGCDASHRGGAGGWVKVSDDGKTLHLPDYSGNNHFNSIGNLVLDMRMGVTIPRFEDGGMIQLTGTATIDFDEGAAVAAHGAGAKRVIVFSVDEVVDIADGTFPIRWSSKDIEDASKPRQLVVSEKIVESEDVVSFTLSPEERDAQILWPFLPGQHLPISLNVTEELAPKNIIDRTYSLSCGPDWGTYRISVKREPFGSASRYVHDKIKVGDMITVRPPAGDFYLDKDATSTRKQTTVLISAGIGITPMMAMLHEYVNSLGETPFSSDHKPLVFVHGARDGNHHPLGNEVNELTVLGGKDAVKTHIRYSRPLDGDTAYDSNGRVDAALLEKIVPDLQQAEFYLCGPVNFMADIQEGLEKRGVDPTRIHSEAF